MLWREFNDLFSQTASVLETKLVWSKNWLFQNAVYLTVAKFSIYIYMHIRYFLSSITWNFIDILLLFSLLFVKAVIAFIVATHTSAFRLRFFVCLLDIRINFNFNLSISDIMQNVKSNILEFQEGEIPLCIVFPVNN